MTKHLVCLKRDNLNLKFLVFLTVAFIMLFPCASLGQTGTLTDDAFTSPNRTLRALNLSGSGSVIVVSGVNATLSGVPAGPATSYIKFKLTPILPPGTVANDISKATLKLFASNVTIPSSFEVSRVIGSWTERTINSATTLTLVPEVTGVPVNSANSFVVVDLTLLVKDWLSQVQPNNGIALVASTSTSYISFDSKESPVTSHEPRLEITLNGSDPTAFTAGTGISISGTTISNTGVLTVSANGPLSSTGGPNPDLSLTGVVPIANGGTGLNTTGAADNFLRSNGSGWVSSPLSASDIPSGSGSYIQNTTAEQPSSNFNISGNGTVNGIITTNVQYNIGNNRVLGIKDGGNLYVGPLAGFNNTDGAGNTFVGASTGQNNTSGEYNSFFGAYAGQNNIGSINSFFGNNAGRHNTGHHNAFFGNSAGGFNTTGWENSFFGAFSGQSNTTARGNSFFGALSGPLNTAGAFNTFVGAGAGYRNTTGHYNAFFGNAAGSSNTTDANSFFGYAAGRDTTTGGNNAFFGMSAGQSNTTGFANSFFGGSAGFFNTTGSFNAFFGIAAGQSNTTGGSNSFFGSFAGTSNTTAQANAFFGSSAGLSNTTGPANSFFGSSAGFSNTVGSDNAFFGTNAGLLNTTGSFNAFFGRAAGQNNSLGSANAFFGTNAGLSNTTSSSNAFFGSNAGFSNITGSANAFFGSAAGFANTTGAVNAFFGSSAGASNTTGSSNAFVGNSAGLFNTTGSRNVFVGADAGQANTTGHNNAFLGSLAGSSNTTGFRNVFLGADAGLANSTGADNTFVGPFAGQNTTTGSHNTFVGEFAGHLNVTGSGLTLVGAGANATSDGLTDATAIGRNATVSTSNTIVLGTSAMNVLIPGNLSITGSIAKGSGSFRIDHPLDPANKTLSHSFVESPDMMNIYNGDIITDDQGNAAIRLPAYFEALNRDFRYQLTVIGQFAQAIVASEIKNNQFSIKTDKPNVRVSWQVTGIRKDPYANANRVPVEQDKPPKERGTYLHPELNLKALKKTPNPF